ncbi:MAG TPA: response regulator [Kofleriaceae bacterium]|nr:response regulator [Kofleriaceae bacterium]
MPLAFRAAFLLILVTGGVAFAVARIRTEAALARHAVVIGHLLWSALLLHQCADRADAYLMVFGALAFLAWYRHGHVQVSEARRELGERRNEVADLTIRLAEQRAALVCQREAASVDGILLVSNDDRVIFSNRGLLEMWRITDPVDGGFRRADLRRAALDQVTDPKRFLTRIADVRLDVDIAATEQLTLGDGRVIEAHTAPIWSDVGERIGRGFFFRDVTSSSVAGRAVSDRIRELEERVTHHSATLGVVDAELANGLRELREIEMELILAERLAAAGRLSASACITRDIDHKFAGAIADLQLVEGRLTALVGDRPATQASVSLIPQPDATKLAPVGEWPAERSWQGPKGTPLPAPLPAPPSRELPPEQPARVLVIDDDPMVVASLRRVLRGHDLTPAGSGRQALGILAQREFDVILCDIIMPEMSGIDFYWNLEAVSPEQCDRVLFMTGGALTDEVSQLIDSLGRAWLEKPFTAGRVRELVEAVRAAAEADSIPLDLALPLDERATTRVAATTRLSPH